MQNPVAPVAGVVTYPPPAAAPAPFDPQQQQQQWMLQLQQQQQQAAAALPHSMMPSQQFVQPHQAVMQTMPPPPPPPQQLMQPQVGVMQPQPQPQMQQPQPYMQPQPQAQQAFYAATAVPQQGQPMQDAVRSLWIGDLQEWMDENYLLNCFGYTGEVVSVKLIRNKLTGQSEGYAFIEFATHGTAEKILQSYNGSLMPQTEQAFRLNWASVGSGERRSDPAGADQSIFVGDLASDVTDQLLLETFRTQYPSVISAKVVIDTLTGRSKGYGFVRFGDEFEKTRAITEMNGVYCSSRPMRIGLATPKKFLGASQSGSRAFYQGANYGAPTSQNFAPADNDPNNTTVFVGGLGQSVTDEDLRQAFSPYGEIVYVKIPVGKGCGFVQYTTRASAEEALQKLHGTMIGQQTLRLSWGRSPVNKQRQPASGWGQGWAQPHQDPNQWNGGYYGYNQAQQVPSQGQGYGYSNYQDYGGYSQ